MVTDWDGMTNPEYFREQIEGCPESEYTMR
jgi:hypothetical protein